MVRETWVLGRVIIKFIIQIGTPLRLREINADNSAGTTGLVGTVLVWHGHHSSRTLTSCLTFSKSLSISEPQLLFTKETTYNLPSLFP